MKFLRAGVQAFAAWMGKRIANHEQLWFAYIGPHEYPGFGNVKTFAIVKIADVGLNPCVAFTSEELAKYHFGHREEPNAYCFVELGQIDNSFYFQEARNALVFSSRKLINEYRSNADNFPYQEHLVSVKWPAR